MKVFFVCIVIALLVSVNSIFGLFLPKYNLKICFFIQNILFLLDLFFWGLFFLKVLRDKKSQRIMKVLFAITFSIAAFILYINGMAKVNLQALAVINICKTIFCILFYHHLFKIISIQNLFKDPLFWIVTGVIFYSCLSLPFYGLNNYIKLQFPPLIATNIFSISNMLIIIKYLFFIKAFLCTINLRRV